MCGYKEANTRVVDGNSVGIGGGEQVGNKYVLESRLYSAMTLGG